MRRRTTRNLLLTFAATLLPAAAATCCAEPTDARIEHLVRAAVHLDQAQLPAQADEIRGLLAGQDEQARRRLLETRLRQIEELQREVALLRQTLHSSDDRTKVILRCKVLELSLDKLNRAGLGVVSIRQLLESESPTSVVDTGGSVLQFLETLQAQDFAKLIAEPTLVTRDGQRASLEIRSGELASSDRQIVYSDLAMARQASAENLHFECTPTVGQLGMLRLELVFRRTGNSKPLVSSSEQGPDRSGKASHERPNSSPPPVEMMDGQTLILADRKSDKPQDDATVTLLLLETETVPREEKANTLE
jgi:hypothetical protein